MRVCETRTGNVSMDTSVYFVNTGLVCLVAGRGACSPLLALSRMRAWAGRMPPAACAPPPTSPRHSHHTDRALAHLPHRHRTGSRGPSGFPDVARGATVRTPLPDPRPPCPALIQRAGTGVTLLDREESLAPTGCAWTIVRSDCRGGQWGTTRLEGTAWASDGRRGGHAAIAEGQPDAAAPRQTQPAVFRAQLTLRSRPHIRGSDPTQPKGGPRRRGVSRETPLEITIVTD